MATILKAARREFMDDPKRQGSAFRIATDASRAAEGVVPRNLNFDMRRLGPGCYSAPYHSHRFAEELFMIVSGAATLRTPQGLEEVGSGDVIFFEMGDTGAHQLYNHTDQACVFLDIRTFMGCDVCDYPDSDKVLIAPSLETYPRGAAAGYLDGEDGVQSKWEQLKKG